MLNISSYYIITDNNQHVSGSYNGKDTDTKSDNEPHINLVEVCQAQRTFACIHVYWTKKWTHNLINHFIFQT